jgi:hypothetical protein
MPADERPLDTHDPYTAGVGTQLTDGFVNMADAVLVAIGLVYLLLVPLVIFFALPLVVIGGFVSLAVTGREFELFALIGLLMLMGIVVTNAIVLHEIEGAGGRRSSLGRVPRACSWPTPQRADPLSTLIHFLCSDGTMKNL